MRFYINSFKITVQCNNSLIEHQNGTKTLAALPFRAKSSRLPREICPRLVEMSFKFISLKNTQHSAACKQVASSKYDLNYIVHILGLFQLKRRSQKR